ncbi:MAG: hypothetical protein LC795_15620 [Acidobacteria bacterium]|nr:hypothetical protein [Acidobacteriota bacterium]MCA1620704.1 hypothetical protein [Acidobacteriota bacterium]
MAPDTGHIVTNASLQKAGDIYEPVPNSLRGAAARVLRGREEAHVSLTSGGRLSRHAASRRRARRQAAKASRKRNR